jgi:hypothetical protein
VRPDRTPDLLISCNCASPSPEFLSVEACEDKENQGRLHHDHDQSGEEIEAVTAEAVEALCLYEPAKG